MEWCTSLVGGPPGCVVAQVHCAKRLGHERPCLDDGDDDDGGDDVAWHRCGLLINKIR